MKSISQLILASIFIVIFQSNSSAQFVWPNGAKAAVCLTYDDGLDCHLDVAVPQLDKYELKGTFYCTGKSESLYSRMDEWRKIVENGHEIGNHTLFHPCDGNANDWVKPEYDLNKYTVEQLLAELKTASTLLKAIDGNEKRTFAYTCSDMSAGGVDFTNEIKPLFSAARSDGPVPESMKQFDLYKTPSWGVNEPTTEELIAYVEKARTRGTIAIFMFHSVGDGYLNVGAEQHRQLLDYLATHKEDYYCATFAEITNYIRKKRDGK